MAKTSCVSQSKQILFLLVFVASFIARVQATPSAHVPSRVISAQRALSPEHVSDIDRKSRRRTRTRRVTGKLWAQARRDVFRRANTTGTGGVVPLGGIYTAPGSIHHRTGNLYTASSATFSTAYSKNTATDVTQESTSSSFPAASGVYNATTTGSSSSSSPYNVTNGIHNTARAKYVVTGGMYTTTSGLSSPTDSTTAATNGTYSSAGLMSTAPSQSELYTSSTGDLIDTIFNASTQQPNGTATSGQVDCSNIKTGRDNKCWNELSLTGWVNNWVTAKSKGCHINEGFANCFLRLEGIDMDCSGIKLWSCSPPQNSTSSSMSVEAYYVAYNIYAINEFFNSWYQAVTAAGSQASLNVDQIVQLIDPPDNTALIVDDILIGLTGIFTIAPVPLVALREALSITQEATPLLYRSYQMITDAITGFPQIGRYLFPTGSAQSQLVQMAKLKSEMATLMQQVEDNLNNTLSVVMSQPGAFLAFASQGNFSANAPSFADQTNQLLYGFNTYIASEALAGNGIRVVIARDTSPQELATNGTKLNYPINCGSYNDVNVCDTWWYDEAYHMTFGLDNFGAMNRDYGDVTTTLLSNYTTPQLLFEGALACNQQGGYNQPVNMTISPAGVNTACLSKLQTLTWNMGCKKTQIGSPCEFLEGTQSQNTFMGDCGSHSYFSVMDDPVYCVPHSYLGPLISQTSVKLKRT